MEEACLAVQCRLPLASALLSKPAWELGFRTHSLGQAGCRQPGAAIDRDLVTMVAGRERHLCFQSQRCGTRRMTCALSSTEIPAREDTKMEAGGGEPGVETESARRCGHPS